MGDTRLMENRMGKERRKEDRKSVLSFERKWGIKGSEGREGKEGKRD